MNVDFVLTLTHGLRPPCYSIRPTVMPPNALTPTHPPGRPPSSCPPDVDTDEGLSQGALVGIIVGSVVGGGLLIALGMSSTD